MADNDFQRASMRSLGKKILLGDEIDESVEPIESTPDDPAILKLTRDEELDLFAAVSASPLSSNQQALPPLELDMPPLANITELSLPLTDDLQSLVADAYETTDQLSSDIEAIPPLEDASVPYILLNPADAVLPPEVAALVDENFEAGDQPAPKPTSPQPTASIPAPAGRKELSHMLPLIAGWVVAILVLIYQLIKDTKKDDDQ